MSPFPPSRSTSDAIPHTLRPDGVTRVISDLHLGHPGSLYNEVEEIFPLFEGAREVIFNGDTTEECSRALRPRSEEMFADLCGELARRGIEFLRLRGNHDASADHPGALRLFGGKVLITHGDACYHYGSPWSRWIPGLKKELDAIHAAFEEKGIHNLEDRLRLAQAWASCYHPPVKRTKSKLAGVLSMLTSAVWPPTVGWRLVKERALTIPRAVEFLERFAPETKVMIFGHIHRNGVFERNGRTLVNTGAFQPLAGRSVCDLDGEGITVRSVIRGKGNFVLGRADHTITWQSLGIDPLHDQGEE